MEKALAELLVSPDCHHHLTEYQSKLVRETHIEHFLGICKNIPTDFYISESNAKLVFTLLENTIHCFDTTLADGDRYRRCNVILGLKNTGKSTLVKTLKQAITRYWTKEKCITVFADARNLTTEMSNITSIIKKKCTKRGMSEITEEMPLKKIAKTLKTHKLPLLVVIDEAQDLYPLLNASAPPEERKLQEQATQTFVNELCTIAEAPGCVAWITGSSQALYSLYSDGFHPAYSGRYYDLNHKKFRPLHYVGLRDSKSIEELFVRKMNKKMDKEEVKTLYIEYGGAIGDLLQRQGLQQSYAAKWNKASWAVLHRLVAEQPATNEEFPWNLNPLTPVQVSDTIKAAVAHDTDEPLEAIMQGLCDQYILERDSNDRFSVAYPSLIRDFTKLQILYEGNQAAAIRYIKAREALLNDNIPQFLNVVLHAMHNVPNTVNSKIRQFESYPHSIIHVLLWLCHPQSSQFSSSDHSQDAEIDIFYANKYRHYVELKKEGNGTPRDACAQIKSKNYNKSFPRTADSRPAFYYGVQWTNHSTQVLLYIECDDNASSSPLWNDISDIKELSVNSSPDL